ncbi:LysR substrate-binding domain-containing protein [Roseovarius sp. EL26]|uniref:LysR substrate-binding domain-containing protein n=1 Tax=Roseovarius sp. EL26 TaxID=2126672 RepID=UPI000EA207D4|nr:LysR substrate-binding domain-containing protein [Roseovarius sp. EL26]
MMNLPHLSFLRSFEAAARHLSFTSAADELNCTQSAVSNHVRSLEKHLGRPLFVRHPQSLSLTDLGTAYLPSVRQALVQIDMATQSLMTQTVKREVVLSCPVTLAGSWLPNVLDGFHQAHPDVELTVHGTIWDDVAERVSDISITVCHDSEAAPQLRKLWADQLTLVCAPDFEVEGVPLTKPGQLPDADLIHILGRPAYWKLISTQFDLIELETRRGAKTNSSNLALELAANGLGCAVLPRSLVLTQIKRGLLIEPFDLDIKSPWNYYLNVAETHPSQAVRRCLDWLMSKAEDMQGKLDRK